MSMPVQPTTTLFVGSNNPNKVKAAKEAFSEQNPAERVEAVPCNARHGIRNWKSNEAVGQPFGSKQTAFGAINRMNDCWERHKPGSEKKIYAVGFENGLVKPQEVGRSGSQWFDVCFAAVRNSEPDSSIIIKRGQFVQTEFAPPENGSQEAFDKAVKTYEELIMPKIHRGEDLYLEWTKSRSDPLRTRSDFLKDCKTQALKEQAALKKAKSIVDTCVAAGMTASAGPRYQNMLWMRDLAYMAPVYLERGYEDSFLSALRSLKDAQCNTHDAYNNQYEVFDRYGNVPIVCIPPKNQRRFLIQRIHGTETEEGWQRRLWNYCERHVPSLTENFPHPPLQKGSDWSSLSVDELRTYYCSLQDFRMRLERAAVANSGQPPKPSYSLRNFMEGTLEDLTPGTRDSEIHYIRAVFALVEHAPAEQQALIAQFSPSLAKAVFYLYMNVVDPEDRLPKGADSRDIFADILYDSKLLTNAVFWHQALAYLVKYAGQLEKYGFSTTLRTVLNEHLSAWNKTVDAAPPFLKELLGSQNLQQSLYGELAWVRFSIYQKLLLEGGRFKPRDFIPGKRAELALKHPIQPTPVAPIIEKDFPAFIHGLKAEPQSLAHAVLAGLIPNEYYEAVMDIWEAADSPIGIQVFVPISGKSPEESALLERVKGQVVWPHVAWAIVRALIAMGSERSLNMAEEQREKLTKLNGCGEWYAIDPASKSAVQGGDSRQGWAATGMIEAIHDFYRFYSSYDS